MVRNKFKAGELVQLKAGGPKMVVEEWGNGVESYSCTWFSGAKHNRQWFKEEALQPYVEDNE